MRGYRLTDDELKIMEAASKLDTGGMSAFTAYWFSPVHGEPRWDLVGKSPEEWGLEPGQYVPWIPLWWQIALAHDERKDITIIGGFGCGKTVGMAAVATYWCCMVPNFKFMNVAPVGWQAKQMYDAVRQDLVNYDNPDSPRHIGRLVVKMVEKPYPKIIWYNGSSMEFMSADEQGKKILSWTGDAISIDEAGKLEDMGIDLDELLMNLGTRLRGVTGGRQRLGKLVVMSNADYCPALWDRFDMAEIDSKNYLSIKLTTYDNPYLTSEQVDAFKRRIKDPIKQRQYMLSERPLPRGKEFPPSLLERAQDPSLDERMANALQNNEPGYTRAETPKAGVVLWVTPPNPTRRYILLGDPGQNTPPARNSAVVMVFDVTGFPNHPAELDAFAWVDGNGSYWPFINKVEEWHNLYRPVYAGYDATGVQKGFNELVFAQRGLLLEGINVQGKKNEMVVALKLLMGRGLIKMPEGIQGIWMQLGTWRLPDTKLRQDIASCLFMVAHVLHRFFFEDAESEEEDDMTSVPQPVANRPRRVGTRRLLRQNPARRR